MRNKNKIKRLLKISLSSQQADGVFPRNFSLRDQQSLIAKSDDAAELQGIKPNLAIKKFSEISYRTGASSAVFGNVKMPNYLHLEHTRFATLSKSCCF